MTGNTRSAARNQNALQVTYDSAAFQAGEVVNAAPCVLCGVVATNKGASVAYVQIFDSTGAPSGAPSLAPIAIPAGATVALSFCDPVGAGAIFGVALARGLSWGASTTPATYTSDSTDIWCSLRYIT